jgi:hypothetical protein
MKPLVIAPSILAADFGCLREEARAVYAAGADFWTFRRLACTDHLVALGAVVLFCGDQAPSR